MIDSGASTQFISPSFILKHSLATTILEEPQNLTLFDGTPAKDGQLTHLSDLQCNIGNHREELAMYVTTLQPDVDIVLGKSWLGYHNPAINWAKNTVTFSSGTCQEECLRQGPTTTQGKSQETTPSIAFVSASAFTYSVESKDSQLYAISIQEIDQVLNQRAAYARPDHVSSNNLDQELERNRNQRSETEELAMLKDKIPSEYHDFMNLFLKKGAEQLPPHRYVDHEIPLVPDARPPFGPLYSMSTKELQVLKDYLDENLSKGFIRASSSSAAAPVLFVRKADGSIRVCVDYRALNDLTIKNRYPLPLISETLQRLSQAKIITRQDLRWAYNLIRIKKGGEWKTAFRTRYGLFEYLVMPFGLTNAPATCQQFVNDVLRQFLDVFCVCYLDDIMIYSQDPLEHVTHVRMVLEKLREAGLYVKGEKCEFHTEETAFLGFIVGKNGISMDPAKVEAVKKWESPRNVHDLQQFLGFANFYRRFIKAYSKLCHPFYKLLQKDTPWSWGPDSHAQRTFERLKTAFCEAPILRHFDPELPIIMETDASDTVVSGILSQKFPDGDKHVLHPICYFSKKMSPAECNYGIGDKELLAIVLCFEEWHQYLEGSKYPVQVLTDHLNLQSFMTKMALNRRQVRWSQLLANYNFKINFRPGTANVKADPLTRRSGDLPQEGDRRGKTVDSLLRSDQFQRLAAAAKLFATTVPLEERIKEALKTDVLGQSVIKALQENQQRHPTISLADARYENSQLLVHDLAYVPDNEQIRVEIMSQGHDNPAVGHPGIANTYEQVTRNYWWPGMRKMIKRYVRNCATCHRIKPVRHAPYGYLRPLSVPQNRWQHISMDFITGLPRSGPYDSVLVVVCRLSKMAHFIPTTMDGCDAKEVARLFRDNIFRLHGFPESSVSDRGSVFVSEFFRAFARLTKLKLRYSTAFHPQTDGQTERVNAILEQYVRGYCNYQQNDWTELLAMAEFAYNNSTSSTTRMTPFFANYGYHPRFLFELRSDQPRTPLPEIKDMREQLTNLEYYLKAEISYAQSRQSEFADQRRNPAPVYRPGDSVWLLRGNMQTTRPSAKLDFKRVGPFSVEKAISGHAYKLRLPPTMKVHPVFHVSLLEPTATDPFDTQQQPEPLPVIVNDHQEWLVEEILDAKLYYRRPRFLVKWTNSLDPTWEIPDNVKNSPLKVREFYSKNPGKPFFPIPDPDPDSDDEGDDE